MNIDPPINFPELPRSELERAIEDLVDKASGVLATQGRLRSLLAAARAITQNLDLPVVLRSIAQAAVDLVGARYGALAVLGADGELEEYVQVGLTDELMPSMPYSHRSPLAGSGGELKPTPLETITRDHAAAGFPEPRSPIRSFIGVPIRVRGELFGNLYLIDRAGGNFTPEDEELLTALAGTAASAIDQARLLEETQWGRRWAIASAEVSSGLLNEDGADPLGLIAESVAALTDASLVLLIRETSAGALVIEHAWGDDAERYNGRVVPREGSVSGSVIASGNPVVSPGLLRSPEHEEWEASTGPAMVLPLSGASGPYGALVVARQPGQSRFHDMEMNMASDFARHASVALELREARHARQRIALLEERSRIARDLHDNVIQRLFGAGLTLHSVDMDALTPTARTKLAQVGDLIDQAVAEIRKSVFALSSTERKNSTARHRLLDVVGEAASSFPTPPRIVFEGQLDEWAPDSMIDDLEAVVREGLANAARHAGARGVAVNVAADEHEISVCVVDDGRGPGPGERSSGTANLEARAMGWGGRSVLRPGNEGGAVLEWRVPTPSKGAA